jgi:ABC-2 type transport system permease protein
LSSLRQALWVELLKASRSKMPLVTALACAMLPLVGGFFMVILRDPELARRAGLISVKAQMLVGNADWPTYLEFLSMASAVGGILVFGLIAGWVFGREHADRTLKDLLALPTSRSAIVGAKFTLIGLWSCALTGIIFFTGLVVGLLLALPPVPEAVFWQGLLSVGVTAGLNIVLATVIAFSASAGGGYMPAFGMLILEIALAQIVAVLGWGEYFPWSVPGLYAQGESLGAISYLIVLLTGLAGAAATFAWWELADHAR